MRSALLIAVFLLSGCTTSTRDGQSQTTRVETRQGTEAGQPTNLKVISKELTDSQEQASTHLDFPELPPMASVATTLAGGEGTPLGMVMAAGTALLFGAQRHFSANRKEAQIKDMHDEMVEMAKQLPPTPPSA